jgi:hypothetical protein
MRCTSTLLLSLCLFLPLPARAQEPTLPSTPVLLPPPPDALTADERRALEDWVTAMRVWQRMDRKWHNEPAHDPFGRIVGRAPKPAPPDWLEGRCALVAPALVVPVSVAPALAAPAPVTIAAPLGPACRILAGLEEDPTAAAIRATTAAKRADAEKSAHNTFLTRVHLDGLWTSTASDLRIYGLVGSHISLVDVGRVQFFGPPGIILLSVPDETGVRRLRAGYTWGLSVRLTDVRLFAASKNMTLFLTISKVWVTGGSPFDRLQPGGFDIAGFSLAPRKHGK